MAVLSRGQRLWNKKVEERTRAEISLEKALQVFKLKDVDKTQMVA